MLSFAVPQPKIERMVADAEETFLVTDAWAKVRGRIRKVQRDQRVRHSWAATPTAARKRRAK